MSNDPTVEFPGMTAPPEPSHEGGQDPLDRLAQEFAERCRLGENPSVAEFEARFPQDAPKVRRLLEAVALMEQLRRDSHRSQPMPERLGEFRIIRELGRGGMGVVYEAEQESLGRHVAVKAIHHVQMDAKRLHRFRLEAQAIARLHHTNIVPIFGVGEHDGRPYYAMQHIRGNGLDALVDRWRKSDAPAADRWRLIAEIGVQAAEALHYAHEQGVLHRDVKPANLLLDENRSVWITDFGLAKLVGGEDITASGDVIGTLRYLAPEALRGMSDPRSDVYSLGLTLYELITLAPPFGELSASELLRHVSEGDLLRPRRLEPHVPRDLETIVLKAIAHEPEHRYRSAHALADDLRRFLEDRPIRARRANAAELAWRWSRRNRAFASLMATAAASLLLAAIAGWSFYAGANAALERETKLLNQARAAQSHSEAAQRHSDENVQLSLKIFGKVFAKLAPASQIASSPLGMLGRRRAGSPDGPGPGGPGPGRGPRNGDRGPRGFGPPPGGEFGSPPGPPPDDGPFAGGPPPGDDGGPPGGRHGPPSDIVMGGPAFGSSETNTSLLDDILEFYGQFARQNAGNQDPKLQGEAAWAYRKVGALYHNLGREEKAEAAYARAIMMFEELLAKHPDDPDIRFKLVAASITSDPWTADPESLAEAETRLSRAKELIDTLAAESPKSLEYGRTVLQVEARLGAVLQRLDRNAEAEACYRRAVELVGGQIEHSPGYVPARLDRAALLEALAGVRIADGRRDEAGKDLDAVLIDLRYLESTRKAAHLVAEHAEKLSKLYELIGRPRQAEEMARWADEMGSRHGEDHPPGPHPREDDPGPAERNHEPSNGEKDPPQQ